VCVMSKVCLILILLNSLVGPQTTTEQSSINPNLPTIFVVGDSTANNHANGALGWGDPFITYFDGTKVNVLNRARAGRSSRTFITEGLWDKVLSEMKGGDFVLIQFGHNDAGPINDETRARGSLRGISEETQEIDNLLTKKHEVVHTYGWYLRKMIADTRAKGARPVLLSLTVRNIWKDGHVERGSGKFSQWAAEIAKSQNVEFIDLTRIIADRYEELGQEKVQALFGADHTHTSPAGAELNAELVVAGLKTLKQNPLGRYFSAKGKAIEKATGLALLCPSSAVLAYDAPASPRAKYNFNSCWKLFVGDANWRTRSYPIRIMVDDRVVFTGETPRSLGYVTLAFPRVIGRSLKIQLMARPRDFDAFGQIVEVTGEKDLDTRLNRGTLAIVELEIYGGARKIVLTQGRKGAKKNL
jgi:rhamnogalacturonan acetylesterase